MSIPDFIYTTYIKSTPEKVWQAITTPEFTRQYWQNENISNWQEGSKWEHVSPEDKEVWVVGTVIESKPPNRLVLTWADPDELTDDSQVTFEIEAMEDVVRLDVIHGKFNANSTMKDKVSHGWPRVLSNLKSFLETGSSLSWAGHACGGQKATVSA